MGLDHDGAHVLRTPMFGPPSPFLKNVSGVGETEILVELQPPQGVFVCDQAGLVINEFSPMGLPRQAVSCKRDSALHRRRRKARVAPGAEGLNLIDPASS